LVQGKRLRIYLSISGPEHARQLPILVHVGGNVPAILLDLQGEKFFRRVEV
jgi:hypothetical protein